MKSSAEPKWQIKRASAIVRWCSYELSLDTQKPNEGISLQHSQLKSGQLLFATPQVVSLPDERVDPFTQGCNLIVAYPCSEKRIFGGELSWRVRNFPFSFDAGGDNRSRSDAETTESTVETEYQEVESLTLELVYSIQTDLLDTHPEKHLISQLCGHSIEFFAEREGRLQKCMAEDQLAAIIVSNHELSTLVTVMPSDLILCSVKIERGAADRSLYNVNWKLAVDFLEKGVIRRFRSFTATGPSREALLASAEAFYQSEIPLTA
jgi:hypothetical protein